MKQNDVIRPIGFGTACAEVEKVCAQAHLYKCCGLRPNHLILPIDPGCGRTTFMEYIKEMFKRSGVLDFSSGLDDYVEVDFDGILQQLHQAFATIDAAAVYTNEYANLVGIGVGGLASHVDEAQAAEFLDQCKRICKHACVVFFVGTSPSRDEEKLIEKLCKAVRNVMRLPFEALSQKDICTLIVKLMADRGVEVADERAFETSLMQLVAEFGIADVKNAVAVADEMIQYADFSGFVPVIDERRLASMVEDWHGKAERSVAK